MLTLLSTIMLTLLSTIMLTLLSTIMLTLLSIMIATTILVCIHCSLIFSRIYITTTIDINFIISLVKVWYFITLRVCTILRSCFISRNRATSVCIDFFKSEPLRTIIRSRTTLYRVTICILSPNSIRAVFWLAVAIRI